MGVDAVAALANSQRLYRMNAYVGINAHSRATLPTDRRRYSPEINLRRSPIFR
ncbi:MAG: hypothetical protein AAF961_18515 [Planctomycetota bacterium]